MEAFALLGFGAALVPLGLIILLIVAVTGGRNEPDPDAERPAALYYAGVLFVAVFTVLFSLFTVVASLLNLTTDENSFDGSEFGISERVEATTQATVFDENGEPLVTRAPTPLRSTAQFSSDDNEEDDADWATAIQAVIVGGLAAGLYVFHDRRRRRRAEGAVGARVRRTYLYATSFVSVIVALISAITALYAVVKIIAPGVTSAGTRGEAGVELAQSAFLALTAGVLFLWHLRNAEPDAAGIGIAPVVPPEPPGPPPVDLEPTPAPRKRRTAPLKAQGR